MDDSAEERITLVALLKHSIMTTPKYLNIVDSVTVPQNAKQNGVVEMITSIYRANQAAPKDAPKPGTKK